MNHCIIPAKGISTRLPMKNKKTLLGKPIIEYVIDTVKEAGVFDRIEVLTDDMDIMRIAEKNGISTLRENADIYSERRTLSDVVMDYICEMDISEGHVSVILPTSVFISPSILFPRKYHSLM